MSTFLERLTRGVTGDTGTWVWAEAYDPYGGIQYTWTNNTFTPERKFSDKERDQETVLDYFGARYYDSGSFRWLSVDPVLDRESAIKNSQRSRNPDTLGRTPDVAKPNGNGSTGRTKTMSAGTAANY